MVGKLLVLILIIVIFVEGLEFIIWLGKEWLFLRVIVILLVLFIIWVLVKILLLLLIMKLEFVFCCICLLGMGGIWELKNFCKKGLLNVWGIWDLIVFWVLICIIVGLVDFIMFMIKLLGFLGDKWFCKFVVKFLLVGVMDWLVIKGEIIELFVKWFVYWGLVKINVFLVLMFIFIRISFR